MIGRPPMAAPECAANSCSERPVRRSCTVRIALYGTYVYIYIYIYIYILSGPWKRWEGSRIVSIGRTPAQRKRNGNVTETLTETLTDT